MVCNGCLVFDFFQILGFNQGEQLSHCEEMSDPNVCFPLNTVVTERIIIYPGTISVQIGNVRKSVEKYFPFFLHVLDIRWTHFMYITLFGDGHSPLNWTLYWKHQKMAHLTPCFKKSPKHIQSVAKLQSCILTSTIQQSIRKLILFWKWYKKIV